MQPVQCIAQRWAHVTKPVNFGDTYHRKCIYCIPNFFQVLYVCSNAYLVPCNILNIVYYNVLHIGTPSIVYNNYYGTTSPCNVHVCAWELILHFHKQAQLISIAIEIQFALDCHHQVDLIILDFSKTFDTVPHQHLLKKLSSYGIDGKLQLTKRSQRVATDGCESEYFRVLSGVPQGTFWAQ